jgi:hypothetical protein
MHASVSDDHLYGFAPKKRAHRLLRERARMRVHPYARMRMRMRASPASQAFCARTPVRMRSRMRMRRRRRKRKYQRKPCLHAHVRMWARAYLGARGYVHAHAFMPTCVHVRT